MIILSHTHDDASSSMKHNLETIDRTVRSACKDGIAVVNARADYACDKGDGSITGQRRMNYFCLLQRVEALTGDRVYVHCHQEVAFHHHAEVPDRTASDGFTLTSRFIFIYIYI